MSTKKLSEFNVLLDVEVFNEDGETFVTIGGEYTSGVTHKVDSLHEIVEKFDDYITDLYYEA